MPFVPRTPLPNVQPGVTPNVQFPVITGNAESAAQLGGASRAIGGALAGEVGRIQDEANQTAIADAENALIGFEQELLFSPDNGLSLRKGRDALDASQDSMTQFDDAASSITGTLSNDAQREAFGRIVANRRARYGSAVGRHVAGEIMRWRAEVAESAADKSGESALSMAGNGEIELSESELSRGLEAVGTMGRVHGWSAARTERERDKYESELRSGIARLFLENDRGVDAVRYLNDHHDRIEPLTHARLSAAARQLAGRQFAADYSVALDSDSWAEETEQVEQDYADIGLSESERAGLIGTARKAFADRANDALRVLVETSPADPQIEQQARLFVAEAARRVNQPGRFLEQANNYIEQSFKDRSALDGRLELLKGSDRGEVADSRLPRDDKSLNKMNEYLIGTNRVDLDDRVTWFDTRGLPLPPDVLNELKDSFDLLQPNIEQVRRGLDALRAMHPLTAPRVANSVAPVVPAMLLDVTRGMRPDEVTRAIETVYGEDGPRLMAALNNLELRDGLLASELNMADAIFDGANEVAPSIQRQARNVYMFNAVRAMRAGLTDGGQIDTAAAEATQREMSERFELFELDPGAFSFNKHVVVEKGLYGSSPAESATLNAILYNHKVGRGGGGKFNTQLPDSFDSARFGMEIGFFDRDTGSVIVPVLKLDTPIGFVQWFPDSEKHERYRVFDNPEQEQFKKYNSVLSNRVDRRDVGLNTLGTWRPEFGATSIDRIENPRVREGMVRLVRTLAQERWADLHNDTQPDLSDPFDALAFDRATDTVARELRWPDGFGVIDRIRLESEVEAELNAERNDNQQR